MTYLYKNRKICRINLVVEIIYHIIKQRFNFKIKCYNLRSLPSCYLLINYFRQRQNLSITSREHNEVVENKSNKENKPNELDSEQRKKCLKSNQNTKNQDLTQSNKDWKVILKRNANQIHVHNLAKAIVSKKKKVNLGNLNEILSYSGLLINKNTLDFLLSRPRYTFINLHLKQTKIEIYKILGNTSNKTSVRGVYIFTCLSTNQKYVGSSSQLNVRLRGYLNQTHKNNSKLISLIVEKGLKDFKLEIICLPLFSDINPEIVLEQYYLLFSEFNLNTIKVSNLPSGSNAKALYMYNRDKTILYYYSLSQRDFISKLNIAHSTFTKHLANRTYYLGKYLFLREKIDSAKICLLTLPELAIKLSQDRVKFNRKKPLGKLSKAVVLINIENEEKLYFESLGKCVLYFKQKGLPVSQKTLLDRLDTNIPYRNYLCLSGNLADSV